MSIRFDRLLDLCTPPIIFRLKSEVLRFRLPSLPAEYKDLERAEHAAFKLIQDYEFKSVLDVGSGAGKHSALFHAKAKRVTALDLGESIYAKAASNDAPYERVFGNFNSFTPSEKFDCVWASHVLEHQPDPGSFIRKCIELTSPTGFVAITVPPMKEEIEGGHLSVWNAGLLLYQLVFNGIDCSRASVLSYGYNVTVISPVERRPALPLSWDSGDIDLLRPYLPGFVTEPFDGRILRWNW